MITRNVKKEDCMSVKISRGRILWLRREVQSYHGKQGAA